MICDVRRRLADCGPSQRSIIVNMQQIFRWLWLGLALCHTGSRRDRTNKETDFHVLLIKWKVDNIHQGWYYQNWCLCNISRVSALSFSPPPLSFRDRRDSCQAPSRSFALRQHSSGQATAQMWVMHPAHRYILNTKTWPHIHTEILHKLWHKLYFLFEFSKSI